MLLPAFIGLSLCTSGLTMASCEGGGIPVLGWKALVTVLKATNTLGLVDGSTFVVKRQVIY